MNTKHKKLLGIGLCIALEIALGLGAYFLLKDLFITGLSVGIAYCAAFDFIEVSQRS